ncbi:hypothetical protein BJY52DRAFT_1223348 [Lactarius psammicola]|nr:hypothetical protein BJY52DRAFT_1223348 [Lactarius psammicola]
MSELLSLSCSFDRFSEVEAFDDVEVIGMPSMFRIRVHRENGDVSVDAITKYNGRRLGMEADKDVHLEINRRVLDSVVITTMVRAFELFRGGSKTSPVDRNWGDAHINAWILKQWYVATWVFDTWPLKKSAERLSNPRTVHFEAGSNMVITASSNGIILSYPRTSQPYTDRWSEKSTLGELKRSQYASRYHVTPYSSDRVWGGTSRKRE